MDLDSAQRAFMEGDFAQAAEDFACLYQAQPMDADLAQYLGISRLNAGQAVLAEGPLRQAASIMPQGNAPFALGMCLYRQGKWEEAASILEPLVEAPQAHPAALESLGICRLRMGQWSHASLLLHQVSELDPTRLAAWQALAELGRKTEDSNLEMRAYQKIIERGGGTPILFLRLLQLHWEHSPQRARQQYTHWLLRQHPSLFEGMQELGARYMEREQFARARDFALLTKSALPPEAPIQQRLKLHLLAAEAAYQLRQWQIAECHYRIVTEGEPLHPVATPMLGKTLGLMQQPQGVIKVLQPFCARYPDHSDAQVDLVVAYFNTCRFEELEAHIAGLSEAMQQDKNLHDYRVRGLFQWASKTDHEGNHAQAAELYRRCLRHDPAFNPARINLHLLYGKTGVRAQLEDFAPKLKAGDLGHHIVLACMPKSGSTFTIQALGKLSGYESLDLFHAARDNEMELYPPALERFATENTYTQQHFRAGLANVALLQAYGINPVVQVRSIPDALISMTDFYASGHADYATAFRDFPAWPREKQVEATLAQMGSWYVTFYATWVRAEREGELSVCWLHYEDLFAHPHQVLSKVIQFLGLEDSPEALARVSKELLSNKSGTRFNKGVTGRGRTELSAEQLLSLRKLTTLYPDVDFSPVDL